MRDQVQTFTTPVELFKRIGPQTFPEKFLVLAAWHEAAAAQAGADRAFSGRLLVNALVELGETPPANPARDVQQALAQGWLARTGHRQLNVTNTGWLHVKEMLTGGGEDSDDEVVLV